MAKSVRAGSVKNKNGKYKWWFVLWWLPNFLFRARGDFLGGEPDKLISCLAFWRAFFGVGALVYIAYRYPGFIGSTRELYRTDNFGLSGLGTMMKFNTTWVASIAYSLILSAMWILLFALLILLITRPGARLALLLHLGWPAATIVLFASQFFLIAQLNEWTFVHVGSDPHSGEAEGILVSFVIIVIWLSMVTYLAVTDVFRGDDAHPLLAPFVATGVSWTVAYSALSSTSLSGEPQGIWLLATLAGPVSVTGLSVWACLRIRKEHGQLLFIDGPPASSRYRAVTVQSAPGFSRREVLRLAVPSVVVIGTAAWWVPEALALAGARSSQAANLLGGTPSNAQSIGQSVYVNSVAFSPDGRTLAAGTTGGTVLLWDVADPASPAALPPPLSGQDGVGPVAFSPDGRTLASGSDGSGFGEGPAVGNIQLWDVTHPANPASLGPAVIASGEVSSLAFSPDGRTLASGSDGTYTNYGASTIQLWDVTDPTRPAALGQSSTDALGFHSLAFSPRGHTLASGDVDGEVQLWNVSDPARPIALAHFYVDTSGFVSVAFSPDGRTLASGDNSGQVRLWNVSDPARPAALGPPLSISHSVSSLAFSPDGHTLAASSNGGYASTTNTTNSLLDTPGYIRLWNISDPARPGRPSPNLTSGTGSAGFCSVAFSPDGRILASGSDSAEAGGGVRLWNVSDPARPTALGQPLP